MCLDKASAHTLAETTPHPSKAEVLLYKQTSRMAWCLAVRALILCPAARGSCSSVRALEGPFQESGIPGFRCER